MRKSIVSVASAGILAAGLTTAGVASSQGTDTPTKETLCSDPWPGQWHRVPAHMIGKSVDTVVGHTSFRVGRFAAYSDFKGTRFVINCAGKVGIS